MKKLLIFFAFTVLLASCKKDKDEEPTLSNQDTNTSTAKGTVFFGNNTKMYALNTADGSKKWEYDAGATSIFAPVAYKDALYFTAGQRLYALDANTGALKWKKTNATLYYTPIIKNDIMYIGNSESLYALNTSDGSQRWKVDIFVQYITLGENGIYVQGGGKVTAFNFTGTKLWETPSSMNFTYYPQGDGAYLNNTLYVTDGINANSKMYALDTQTGNVKWTYNFTGVTVSESPTVDAGIVYVTSRQGTLYAINTANGTLAWSKNSISTLLVAHPTIYQSQIYLLSYDPSFILALDKNNGNQKWKVSNNNVFDYQGYTLDKVNLYIGNDSDKKMYAFDINTGAKKWEYTISGTSSFNGVCVVDTEGNVYYSALSGMRQ